MEIIKNSALCCWNYGGVVIFELSFFEIPLVWLAVVLIFNGVLQGDAPHAEPGEALLFCMDISVAEKKLSLIMPFMDDTWSTPNSWDRDFKRVPTSSGIYVLLSYDKAYRPTLEYVGSSKNLRQRWAKHEVLRVLEYLKDYVRFYFKEATDYKEREIELIRRFSPPLNTQYRKPLAS